jgi:hypothetical protein
MQAAVTAISVGTPPQAIPMHLDIYSYVSLDPEQRAAAKLNDGSRLAHLCIEVWKHKSRQGTAPDGFLYA